MSSVVIVFSVVGVVTFELTWSGRNQSGLSGTSLRQLYAVGLRDSSEPSGYAPLGANSVPGFIRTYVQDFGGTSIPQGWDVFTGIPGGDPGAHFGAAHVVVDHGVLTLSTFRDSHFGGNWVTGGICSCGIPRLYGAFFVRSRVTGPGPNEAELLWPESDIWPPEIDFNESPSVASTSATIHWSVLNRFQQWFLHVNLTKWHTWGVIWTPTKVLLTLDGRQWGETTAIYKIPNVPMRLDLEQRTKCSQNVECPTQPTSLVVDWVEEFRPA